MDGRPPWTDCDEAGDYVVHNVLSPRDLVFRADNMDETVPHNPEDRFSHDAAHLAPEEKNALFMHHNNQILFSSPEPKALR